MPISIVDFDPFAQQPQPADTSAPPAPPSPHVTVDFDPFQKNTDGSYKEPPIDLQPGERVISLSKPKSEDVPQPPSDTKPGIGESFARGALQGATFNFGDRIAALEAASGLPEAPAALGPINTMYNMGRLGGGVGRKIAEALAPSIFGQGGTEAYNQKFAQERAANEAARAENPTAFTLGGLAGGIATIPLAPSLAPFKIAEGAALLPTAAKTVGNLATAGAGYGAVAGAGGAPSVAQMPQSAGEGALVGGILGPAVGLPIAGATKLGGLVASDIAARTNPQKVADQVVARNLAADNPAGAVAAAAEAKARMEAAQAQPIPQNLTMVDTAGPKTQGMGGTLARSPGEAGSKAKSFFEERHLGQDPFNPDATDSAAGRITDAISSTLGNKNVRQTADTLIATRKANAEPLYAAAHIKPIDYDAPSGQQLKYILENQLTAADKASANTILRREDKSGLQMIWAKNKDGEFELTKVPNMRQWDYIQQGLQNTIDNGRDKFGQFTTEARAAIRLKKEINAALEENNSAFKAAKKVYAGDSDMIDALRAGRDITKKTADDVAHDLSQLRTPGERELYRIGASEAYRLKISKAPRAADMVKQIFNSREEVKKIRAIAPDQGSFDTLKKFLAQESGMFKSGAEAIGGSQTAGRLADDVTTGQQLAEYGKMLMQAHSGYIWGLMHGIGQQLSRIKPENRAAVMEAARKVALNPDPQAVQAFIDRLNSGAKSMADKKAVIDALVRGVPRAATTQSMGAQ